MAAPNGVRLVRLLCSSTFGCVLLFLSLLFATLCSVAQSLPEELPWEGRGSSLQTLRIQESFATTNLVAREWLQRHSYLKSSLYSLQQGNNREIESFLYPRPISSHGVISEGEWRDSTNTYFGAAHLAFHDYGERRWTKLTMPQLFYPYLVLDSTEAQPRNLTGMVSGGVSRRMESSTFALLAEYRGQRLQATGGSEHKGTLHNLRLREGLSIPLGRYWFSQWGEFAYRWQQYRAASEQPIRFFRHIGFGLWDLGRTTVARQIDLVATSGRVSCGLQLAPHGAGVLASLSATHRWGTTSDIHQRSVASFVLQELHLLLGYDYSAGQQRLQAAVDASWQNRTGVEQFYDSVGRRGNKKYQLLFSEPTYKARYRTYGIQLVYSAPLAAWTYGARLWAGYTSQESEYNRPSSHLHLTRWKTETTLHLAWQHARHRCALQAAWIFFTRATQQRDLSRYIREPLRSEFLLPEIERRLPPRHYLMATVEYAYTLPNGLTLSVAPEVGYLRSLGGGALWRGGIRLGVAL